MSRLNLIHAKDPDTDDYWLVKGSSFIRCSDGEPGILSKTLKVEIPLDLMRSEEDIENPTG